jgi:hypothetical protein
MATAEPLVPEPSAFNFETAIEKFVDLMSQDIEGKMVLKHIFQPSVVEGNSELSCIAWWNYGG